MPVAQLALAERCSSIVDISGDCGGTRRAATDGALRRVFAREQLNLGGHSLFLLELRVVLAVRMKAGRGPYLPTRRGHCLISIAVADFAGASGHVASFRPPARPWRRLPPLLCRCRPL